MLQHFLPVVLIESQQYFGVRRRGESMAKCVKLFAKDPKVVDLAIEGDHIIIKPAAHRLVPARSGVDYGKTLMRKCNTLVLRDPKSLAVRPTAPHRSTDISKC